jgi:hypothetical protein
MRNKRKKKEIIKSKEKKMTVTGKTKKIIKKMATKATIWLTNLLK